MQDAFDYALAERDRRMLEEAHVEVSTTISKLFRDIVASRWKGWLLLHFSYSL